MKTELISKCPEPRLYLSYKKTLLVPSVLEEPMVIPTAPTVMVAAMVARAAVATEMEEVLVVTDNPPVVTDNPQVDMDSPQEVMVAHQAVTEAREVEMVAMTELPAPEAVVTGKTMITLCLSET
jgi:hypothetical protein